MILSNDRNLCNKSIVFGVQAFTQKTVISGLSKLFGDSGTTEGGGNLEKISDLDKQVDQISCEFQSMLRDTFTKIIETEMIDAYGDLWLEIVKVKPPWTLGEDFL